MNMEDAFKLLKWWHQTYWTPHII